MTTPPPVPPLAGADARHVWLVCTAAAAGVRPGTSAGVAAGADGTTRVSLPSRDTARAARAALGRAGYEASQPSGGRDLIVHGLSGNLLDARLEVLRSVLTTLRSAPGTTARYVLDQVGHLPPEALPDKAGRQWLTGQARRQLQDWITRTAGHSAPPGPAGLEAGPGVALRLSAARSAEQAIAAVTDDHLRIAAHALGLYPVLRQTRPHAHARSSAISQAAGIAHVALPAPDAAGQADAPWLPGRGRRGTAGAREFPDPGPPAAPPLPVTSLAAGRLPGAAAGRRAARP